MKLTPEEFQKAKRISREVQSYLESVNKDGLRSTDLYPILAHKKLIEKDKENGIHFRKFLRHLYEMDVLKTLIPQCKPQKSHNNDYLIEWFFYRVYDKDSPKEVLNTEQRQINLPAMAGAEIDELIKQCKPEVEKLPKRNLSDLSYPELETRKLYARAYEFWTRNEIEIMKRMFAQCKNIDKTAELLNRQPSAVRRKLKELNIEI